MKSLSLMAVLFFGMLFSNNSFAQSEQKDTIKVWGNCGSCKKKIEKAAKSAGAQTAVWDADTHQLIATYKTDKTSNLKIQEAIAKVGYDTQDFAADNDTYNSLPGCCQYERKVTTGNENKKCCADSNCTKDEKGCNAKGCCKDKGCCKH